MSKKNNKLLNNEDLDEDILDEDEELLDEDILEEEILEDIDEKEEEEDIEYESNDDRHLEDLEGEIENIDYDVELEHITTTDDIDDYDTISLFENIIDPYKEENLLKTLDDSNFYHNLYNEDNNLTTKYLTKYEKVRILSERASMLEHNAKTTLDYNELNIDIDKLTPYEIAELELLYKCMPLIIERSIPNIHNTIVYIDVNKLIDINTHFN